MFSKILKQSIKIYGHPKFFQTFSKLFFQRKIKKINKLINIFFLYLIIGF